MVDCTIFKDKEVDYVYCQQINQMIQLQTDTYTLAQTSVASQEALSTIFTYENSMFLLGVLIAVIFIQGVKTRI